MRSNFYVLMIVAASFAASAAASADSVPVRSLVGNQSFEGFAYHFGENDGTAWLNLNIRENLGMVCHPAPVVVEPGPVIVGPGPFPRPFPGPVVVHRPVYAPPICEPRIVDTTVTASVPGLMYDTAAAQIVYMGPTHKAVCATITDKHGLFGNKWIITPTGECRVMLRSVNGSNTVYFVTN